jgi:hypothetical protein
MITHDDFHGYSESTSWDHLSRCGKTAVLKRSLRSEPLKNANRRVEDFDVHVFGVWQLLPLSLFLRPEGTYRE